MDKLISVIIPVKNGEQYLAEAIQGIQKQNMNVEIIVVDDASTDTTAGIAGQMGATVLHHEQSKGPVAAKNTGLGAAKGEYILFHDGDDVMREGALDRLYRELESDAETGAVMAKVRDFISPELTDAEKKNCVIKPDPYYGLFTGAVLIRASVFTKIGMFDERLRAGEIMDWQSRMTSSGLPVRKVDFVSADRRIHKSNFGITNRTREYQDYAAILRARLHGKNL